MPPGSPEPGPDRGDAEASYSELLPPLPPELEGDVAGRDFSGQAFPKASLRGRDLSGVVFRDADLRGADLRDATLAGVDFTGADLRGAHLEHADLSGADLSRADLRDANLDGATLERTILAATKLAGATAHLSHWRTSAADGGDWAGFDLRGAQLERVEWTNVGLADACLADCRVEDCDFVRVRLDGGDLRGAKVVDTTWTEVELRGADLRKLRLQFANVEWCSFDGARLDGAKLESVAFKAGSWALASAEKAALSRCSGVPVAAVDSLRSLGADAPLPWWVEGWRFVMRRPAWAAGLLVAVAGVAVAVRLLQPAPSVDEPPPEDGIESLAGVDEDTQERWVELMKAYEEQPQTRPASLLGLAELLERAGRDEDAEEKLREAVGLVALHPEQAPETPPQLALAQLLVRMGETDESFDLAREVISTASAPGPRAEGFLMMARVRAAQEDADAAMADLGSLLELFAASPDAAPQVRIGAAQLLVELQRPEQAEALLAGLPPGAPPAVRSQALLDRATILRGLGRIEAAEAALGELEAAGDADPVLQEAARLAREELAAAEADVEARAERLEALVQAGGEGAAEAALGLARLAVRADDTELAKERYRAVIEGFEGEPTLTARRELAKLWAVGGDVKQATKLLEQAEQLSAPGEARVSVREDLARLLQDEGQYRSARKVLRRTLKDRDADAGHVARAQLALAGIADQAGDVDDALELYREVGQAEASDDVVRAAAQFGEAAMLRRLGRGKDALPLMDLALGVLDPSEPLRGQVAVERAELLVELGRGTPDELARMLASARTAGFDRAQPVAYAELLLTTARVTLDAEKPGEALALFERIAQLPGASDAAVAQRALEGRVQALVALGRNEEADGLVEDTTSEQLPGADLEERCFGQAALARTRAETGQHEQAAKAYEGLLPGCRSAVFLISELPVMADSLVSGGLREQAEALLRAVDTEETPPVGRQAAELELGRLGDVPSLERAMEGPDRALAALARITRGEQLAEEGRLAEAEPLWTTVAEDPASEPLPRALALHGLGKLAAVLGQVDRARGFLEEAKLIDTEEWLEQQIDALLADVSSAGGAG